MSPYHLDLPDFLLAQVLKLAPSPREHGGVGWQRGLDYLRFDGTVDADERDTMISHFHQSSLKLRLFLISTRAGGQGLNLAAASRVIVFDASWNPSIDTQAVFRAYRYAASSVPYGLFSQACRYQSYTRNPFLEPHIPPHPALPRVSVMARHGLSTSTV